MFSLLYSLALYLNYTIYLYCYDSVARHSFSRQKLLCVDYSPFPTFSQSLAALEMELNGWSTKSKVMFVAMVRFADFFFLLQETTTRYDL
jgi:hypothetical protein